MTKKLTMREALQKAKALNLDIANRHGTGELRITYRGVFVTVTGHNKDAPRALQALLRDAELGREPRKRT